MKERLQVGTETRSTLQILTPFQALVMIVESAIVTAVTAKGAQLAEGSSERTTAGANMMKMKWSIISEVLLDK